MIRSWIWLILLVPVALGLARLHLDVEVLNLLPKSLSVVAGLKTYQKEFAHGHDLIITLSSPSAQTSEEAAREVASILREQPDLIDTVTWQPPFVEQPGQAAEMLSYLWFNSREFSTLTNRLMGAGLTNALLSAREELATTLSPKQLAWGGYDPLGLSEPPRSARSARFSLQGAERLFASEDGAFRVIFVEPAPDLSNYRECTRWLATVQSLILRAQASGRLPGEAKLAYTGRPAFVREIAGGMERDMIASVSGTMLIITGLFYLWHRRWRPLLWLLLLLSLVLVATLGLGGLVFGELNVISMGFAAILLGLAADYALVLYQEAADDPAASLGQIRRQVGGGILWSAITTALAFAMLSFSRMPGLAQLGALVAMGVSVAAVLIVQGFLPPLWPVPHRKTSPRRLRLPNRVAWAVTAFLVVLAGLLLWKDRPQFDQSADALKPRQSEAYAAVEEIKTQLGHPEEPLWVVVAGATVEEVAAQLTHVERLLNRAQSDGLVASFTVPTELWPQPAHQRANRSIAQLFSAQTNHILSVARSLSFAPSAMQLSFELIETWERAADQDVFWPTNSASRWVMESVVASHSARPLALVLVHPPAEVKRRQEAITQLARQWPVELSEQGVILTGWELLGQEIFALVSADLPRVLIPMTLLLVPALSLAFRAAREVLLSLATLAVSALALWIVMDLAGWSWNLMNMMALPLLLGAGVDYSIHIQLAMRRHHGDANKARSTTGWALLLCAATTFAAFGSLGFSSNAGLASLGRVCAAGIACAWVVAVGLLPTWWLGSRTPQLTSPAP